MATAEEYVRAGQLARALEDLQAEVRKKPADPRLRVYLFQLLAVMGQGERALTQLKVASDIDPSAVAMMHTYLPALRAEETRARVFAGATAPTVFGKPAQWMAHLIEALRLIGAGKFEEAAQLRERSFEEAPATTGKIDGKPFAWIADADPRLGPMLEAIVNGRYCWIPFARLKGIQLEKPSDLRDVAWTPATLGLANGGETVALIPTRYPGSETAVDPRIVMARATDWVAHPGETHLGLGQRLLATDDGEFALMDVRLIELDGTDEPADVAEPEPEPDAETA